MIITHKKERRYNIETRGRTCQSIFLNILACSLVLRTGTSMAASLLLTASMSIPTLRLSEGDWGIPVGRSATIGWGIQAKAWLALSYFRLYDFLKRGTSHRYQALSERAIWRFTDHTLKLVRRKSGSLAPFIQRPVTRFRS